MCWSDWEKLDIQSIYTPAFIQRLVVAESGETYAGDRSPTTKTVSNSEL